MGSVPVAVAHRGPRIPAVARQGACRSPSPGTLQPDAHAHSRGAEQVPDEDQQARSTQLSAAQMAKLEELWKSNPSATVDDLSASGTSDDVAPMELHYEDAFQYQNILGPIVKLEADQDQQTKEALTVEGVAVRWDMGLNRKRLAAFRYPRAEAEARLAIGDELRIRRPGEGARPDWEGVGTIVRFNTQEEVVLELRSTEAPLDVTTGFAVDIVWRPITYDRMQMAMRTFAVDETSVSGYLYHRLLGHDVEEPTISRPPPAHLAVPGLAALNHSQQYAVTQALSRPLSLVQGPPGTGKTLTSATIVYHMVKMHGGQTLVCAPSNIAVDHLTEKLHATQLRVVRVCARSREAVPSSVEHLTLHHQVKLLAAAENSALHKLQKLKEETGELSAEDEKVFNRERRAAEMDLLTHADVICCTCVGAADPRLTRRSMRFQQCLVDEATQATEPESLIPIVLGVKQLVLVGARPPRSQPYRRGMLRLIHRSPVRWARRRPLPAGTRGDEQESRQGRPLPVALRAPHPPGPPSTAPAGTVPHASQPVRVPLGYLLRGDAPERRDPREPRQPLRCLPVGGQGKAHALLLLHGARRD